MSLRTTLRQFSVIIRTPLPQAGTHKLAATGNVALNALRIAYLTSKYPAVSHTFILREVRALRARGVEVGTFSVRRPAANDVLGWEAEQEAAVTRWLIPPPIGHCCASLICVIRTRHRQAVTALIKATMQKGLSLRQRARWLCYFLEAIPLARWLTQAGFDHLHCHFGNSGSSTAMLAARLADIPYSITCHGSELLHPQRHRLAEKTACATFVACVSEYGKARLSLVCSPEYRHKLHVVHCGVAPVRPRPDPTGDESAIIVCVARLSPEKGHVVLLSALRRLLDEGLKFRCVLVGDGPNRALVEQRASELRLGGVLSLTGSQPPQRVAELYASASVVVLPSFSEGVPVVLMEALAHGCPVVATRVGGVPELIEHGTHGLLVDPHDSAALATALRRVLLDRDLSRSLAECGRRFVRREFNLDRSTDQLIKLFKAALAVPPASQKSVSQDAAPCPQCLEPEDY